MQARIENRRPKHLNPLLGAPAVLALLLGAGGCASIAQKPLEWVGLREPEPKVSEDPVADAAMAIRNPAGTEEAAASVGSEPIRDYRGSLSTHTIRQGMSMNQVTEVWGEPMRVDTAGDPRDGNQRWVYFSGLSNRSGLGERRVVYFEAGKVAGWRSSY